MDVFWKTFSSDINTLIPYATATYSSGTVADPTALGQVILSQFANAGRGEVDINIQALRVGQTFADVYVAPTATPETGSVVLLLGILPLVGLLRRRKA